MFMLKINSTFINVDTQFSANEAISSSPRPPLLNVGLTDEIRDDHHAHGDGVHGDGEGARPDVGVPEAGGPAGLHVDVRDPGDLHSGRFVTRVYSNQA